MRMLYRKVKPSIDSQELVCTIIDSKDTASWALAIGGGGAGATEPTDNTDSTNQQLETCALQCVHGGG